MGNTPWSNDQPRDLIVPPGAGPNDPRIVIGPDIPPILKLQYEDAVAWIGEYTDADHYHYEIWQVSVGHYYQSTGWVDLTQVGNEVVEQQQNTRRAPGFPLSTASGLLGQSNYTFVQSILNFGSGTQGPDRDIQWNATSLPHGIVDGVVVTSGVLTAAASAETNIPQMALSGNLVAGREYTIEASCNFSQTVATDTTSLILRKTTALTGTEIGVSGSTGGNTGKIRVVYTPAVTGFEHLFFSFVRAAGTGTIQAFGSPSAGIVRTLASIYDTGASTDWRTA